MAKAEPRLFFLATPNAQVCATEHSKPRVDEGGCRQFGGEERSVIGGVEAIFGILQCVQHTIWNYFMIRFLDPESQKTCLKI